MPSVAVSAMRYNSTGKILTDKYAGLTGRFLVAEEWRDAERRAAVSSLWRFQRADGEGDRVEARGRLDGDPPGVRTDGDDVAGLARGIRHAARVLKRPGGRGPVDGHAADRVAEAIARLGNEGEGAADESRAAVAGVRGDLTNGVRREQDGEDAAAA